MKKTIKIAHLYHDIMNLYGENGNVVALKTFIERQGVECEVVQFSLGDRLDFKSCDIYYMGAGSEESEYMVLSEMYDYAGDIEHAIEEFYKCEDLPEDRGRDIIGFKNCHSNIMNNIYDRLFPFPDSIHYKNFYGMTFVGPVCIRNPHFTDYILKNLFEEKGWDYEIHDDSSEYVAYREFVKNFMRNGNLD